MAPITTYDVTAGNRQDILDLIQNVSPYETPIFSRCPDGKASATLHEWVEQTLSSATSNAAVEGATVTGSSSSAKTRRNNYCQIVEKDGAITGTQQGVNIVGAATEMANEIAKKMKEWGTDAENVLILSTSAAGNTSTARTMSGIQDSIQTNRITGSGNTVALNEANFNDLLQKVFENGAIVDSVYCAGFNKRRISQFSTPNTRFWTVSGAAPVVTGNIGMSTQPYPVAGMSNMGPMLSNTVSVYDSDFGRVQVFLNRWVPKPQVIALNTPLWRKAWLRRPFKFDLAKRGDLDEFEIVGEFTNEHLNERAGGLLSAFATATS